MKNNDYTSRRDFLGQSLALLSALYIPENFLQEKSSKHILENGILFSENDLPRIRKNTTNPVFKEYWQSLLNADLSGDIKFLKEELNIHKHFAHLIKAGKILRRSAFVSLVEKNKAHEDIAKLAIEKIHSFEDWDYFTEGGKDIIAFQCAPDALINLLFAYDWMKDKLSKTDKEDMLKAISEKGAKPCYLTLYGMKYPDKVKGWAIDPREEYKSNVNLSKWPIILNRTNLKMIPVTGLIFAALALEGKHTDAKKWLEMGIGSMKDFSTMWEKDGCYSEGFGYSGYSTKHIVLSVDILNRAAGKNYDNVINFKGYSKFLLQMSSPFKDYPGGSFNYGDNGFSADSGFLYWIAKEFRDGIVQFTAKTIPAPPDILSIIWYDDSIKVKNPPSEFYDVKFINDWAVSRTGFTENDTALGIRSGGPANHEHADRNSIILNAFSERLLHDPLGAAYNNTDKHWLLRQTESHTAVLIDGKGHQYHDGRDGTNASDAVAKIIQYIPGKKITVITSDATPAYKLVNKDINKVQRTIALIKPDILIILDEMKKQSEDSKLQARFQAFNVDGKAQLKISGDTFSINRPKARLYAKMISNLPVKISEGKIAVPVDKGIFPYIEAAADSSKDCKLITICSLLPEPIKEEPVIIIKDEKNGYKISIKNMQKTISFSITYGKEYPIIKLLS